MKNSKKNLAGFGMAEAIVSVAIVSLGALAATSMLTNQFKGQRTIDASGAYQDLMQTLRLATSNSTLCGSSIVSAGVDGLQVVTGPIVVNAAGQTFHVGSKVGGNQWTITSSTIDPLPTTTPVDSHLTNLKLVLRKEGESYGGSEKTASIPIVIATNPANQIIECHGGTGTGTGPGAGTLPALISADFSTPGLIPYRVPEGAAGTLRIEMVGAGGAGGGGHHHTGGGGQAGQYVSHTINVHGGEVFLIEIGAGGLCYDNEQAGQPGGRTTFSGGDSMLFFSANGGAGGGRDATGGNCNHNETSRGDDVVWNLLVDPGTGGIACPAGHDGQPGQAPGAGGGGGADNWRGGRGGHGRVKITPIPTPVT